eukprot:7568231-Alexandrium_andersonii.AAC.2
MQARAMLHCSCTGQLLGVPARQLKSKHCCSSTAVLQLDSCQLGRPQVGKRRRHQAIADAAAVAVAVVASSAALGSRRWSRRTWQQRTMPRAAESAKPPRPRHPGQLTWRRARSGAR